MAMQCWRIEGRGNLRMIFQKSCDVNPEAVIFQVQGGGMVSL